MANLTKSAKVIAAMRGEAVACALCGEDDVSIHMGHRNPDKTVAWKVCSRCVFAVKRAFGHASTSHAVMAIKRSFGVSPTWLDLTERHKVSELREACRRA